MIAIATLPTPALSTAAARHWRGASAVRPDVTRRREPAARDPDDQSPTDSTSADPGPIVPISQRAVAMAPTAASPERDTRPGGSQARVGQSVDDCVTAIACAHPLSTPALDSRPRPGPLSALDSRDVEPGRWSFSVRARWQVRSKVAAGSSRHPNGGQRWCEQEPTGLSYQGPPTGSGGMVGVVAAGPGAQKPGPARPQMTPEKQSGSDPTSATRDDRLPRDRAARPDEMRRRGRSRIPPRGPRERQPPV